ncbi:MAG: Mur ligase family protein [Chloroflexota bacterium]|nr:Mur ligase family protein [Chloroflexota bacterium]
MDQKSDYKLNINKLMTLTNFEYEKSKSNPPGFHLERVEYMMKKFDYPNKNQVFIHVAGSKGKGSTSNLISNALGNFKVGLFSSPHMHKLTERIKINNSPISEGLFNFYFKRVWKIVEIMKEELDQRPSFFEFMTLLSLVIFREEKVEVSIIEVGLGGRLDSTNVITPTISVITQISKDHTSILGKNIRKIASEKAGIIKNQIPVVTSNQVKNAYEIINHTAKINKAKLYHSKDINLRKIKTSGKSNLEQNLLFDKYRFRSYLLGKHQIENIKTAIKAVEIFLQLRSKKTNWVEILSNLGKTKMIGRCQIVKEKKLTFIIDGAQNNKSSKALIGVVKEYIKNLDKIVWIYGGSEGHDSLETLKPLRKLNPKIILTQSRIPKAKKVEKISEEIKDLNFNIIELTTDTFNAFEKAKNILNSDGTIVAFGSLYIAAEIVEKIENITPEKYNYG